MGLRTDFPEDQDDFDDMISTPESRYKALMPVVDAFKESERIRLGGVTTHDPKGPMAYLNAIYKAAAALKELESGNL